METSSQRIRRRLERDGWYLARHGSGHDIYRHPSIRGIITMPRHRRLSPAVARSIAKKAGWADPESFADLQQGGENGPLSGAD